MPGTLEVTFENRFLRDICERKKEAEVVLGFDGAMALRALLADFDVVDYVTEVPMWAEFVVGGGHNQVLSFDLCPDTQLICTHAHRKPPLNNSKNVNWSRVSRIKIKQIEQLNVR